MRTPQVPIWIYHVQNSEVSKDREHEDKQYQFPQTHIDRQISGETLPREDLGLSPLADYEK